MTLFSFAYRNIIRDFKTYLYYFMNCVFSVIIFFLFAVLSFHPGLKVIDKNSALGLILAAAELISITFSIAFISYSVNNFLKARSRQFGLITILGASKKQLNRLIFFENIIIGILSILGGIMIGVIFSKLFLSIAGKMIGTLELNFYFPVKAILLSVFVLGSAFFMVAIVTPCLVRKRKIIQLIKTEEMEEKEPPILPFCIALSLSGIGIYIGFANEKWLGLFNLFVLPLGGLFIISLSYILFYFGIKVYFKLNIKNKRYLQGTNLLAMTNLKGSLRTNLQTLTICTVLYSIAFLSIILMVSTTGNVENETRKMMPYAYMYASWTKEADTEGNLKTIEDEIGGLAGFKQEKFTLYSLPEQESRHCIISQSEYNKIAQFLNYEMVELDTGEAFLIAGNVKETIQNIPELYRNIMQERGMEIQLVGFSENLLTLSGYLNTTTVVSDEGFYKIMGELESFDIYAFDVDNWTALAEESQRLMDQFEPLRENREGTFITAWHYYQTEQLTQNLILYVGSVLCFSFLLAVASFIYSRLYSTMEKECMKYKGVVKIGLSRLELYKILNSILKVIVILPYAFALIYMWIGVLMIDRFTIISNVPTAVICTAIYSIMQLLVYLVIKRGYRKNIVKGVYETTL